MKVILRIKLFWLLVLSPTISSWSWSASYSRPNKIQTILGCKKIKSSPLNSRKAIATAREARIIKPIQDLCSVGVAASWHWLNGIQNALAAEQLPQPTESEILSLTNHIEKYFPSVINVKSLPTTLNRVLPGYTKKNTLLVTSISPDVTNYNFIKEIESKYGSAFNIGGLAGVPFISPSEMEGAINRIPNKQGKLLIVVATHVGLLPSKDFQLGKVKYSNKEIITCNFSIEALSKLKTNKNVYDDDGFLNIDDFQENYILQQLQSSKNKPKHLNINEETIAWVTYELFHISQQKIRDIIYPYVISSKISMKDIAFLGGIIINKGDEGDDLFQPIALEVDGKSILSEAFEV